MHSTKKLSCLIVDDDDYSIEMLRQYIEAVPQLELIKSYTDPVVAVKEIAQSKVPIDFLLLDINMPKISGVEMASMIRHKVDKLIFVTAHAGYSLEAYDVLCNQYLLKPFTQQKFVHTMERLMIRPNEELPLSKESMFIKSGNNGKYLMLKFDEIIHFNAMEHYVVIHTTDAQHIQHLSLKEVENALRENPNFIRVHKSHIISKNHIRSVYGNTVVLSNNFEITIGTTFKQAFTKFLNSNLLS